MMRSALSEDRALPRYANGSLDLRDVDFRQSQGTVTKEFSSSVSPSPAASQNKSDRAGTPDR